MCFTFGGSAKAGSSCSATDALVYSRLAGTDFLLLHPMDAWEQQTSDKVEFTAVPAAHDTLALDTDGHHLYLGYVCRYRGWTIYHSGDTVVYDGMVENLC